jgi:hypothetical protein
MLQMIKKSGVFLFSLVLLLGTVFNATAHHAPKIPFEISRAYLSCGPLIAVVKYHTETLGQEQEVTRITKDHDIIAFKGNGHSGYVFMVNKKHGLACILHVIPHKKGKPS